jgi:hypothetical protein
MPIPEINYEAPTSDDDRQVIKDAYAELKWPQNGPGAVADLVLARTGRAVTLDAVRGVLVKGL